MKKVFTLIFWLSMLGAQAQISIPHTAIIQPVVPDTAFGRLLQASEIPFLPSVGPNQVWDYSSLTAAGAPYFRSHFPYDGHPDFVGATAMDYEQLLFGTLPILPHRTYYRSDSTGIYLHGQDFDAQVINLGPLSGNANDSIWFGDSTAAGFLGNSYPLLKFPIEFNGTRTYDMYYGIRHFRLRYHKFNVDHFGEMRTGQFEKDTVLGWGTLTIAANGYNNVPALLMRTVKRSYRNFWLRDSFYPIIDSVLNDMGQSNYTQDSSFVYSFYVFDAVQAKYHAALWIEEDGNGNIIKGGYDVSPYNSTASLTKLALQKQVKVYPNPLQQDDQMQLSFGESLKSPLNLVVYSMGGAIAHQEALNAGEQTFKINLPNLKAGIYFVTAKNAQGEVQFVEQLVKP